MSGLEFDLKDDRILFVESDSGTLGIIPSGRRRTIFMNTPDDEVALFLEPDDLIVISAFSSGEKARRGMMALAYLLLEIENPLVVLPEDHPGSRRLKMVVSASDTIRLSCEITPGTHPDHHLLCSVSELSGMEIVSENGLVKLSNMPPGIRAWVTKLEW
ncbi:hypothetical protein [Methanothermobacter sp.]|uniref:hypothetical protein n=1 Tax=Methanothermobacter sp. TaxID=1884223 RepID=UPI00261338EC|nr:hypothetical protein [Methanothermobacter sp.]MDI9615223.1 hypothetical protein [Methanothermobacter sp.]